MITPENFHDTAQEFLRSATRSIRIEQQYIRGGQQAVEELLKEIDAAREDNPDLDIRIIVSPKFLTGDKRTKFLKAMEDFSLEFDDNYRFLSSKHFVHCHNKLIVVDDEKVLLGSQNWSTTGLLSNREASLLVEHAGIAAYFAADLRRGLGHERADGSAAGRAVCRRCRGLAEPADFAEGGIVISSIRDLYGRLMRRVGIWLANAGLPVEVGQYAGSPALLHGREEDNRH